LFTEFVAHAPETGNGDKRAWPIGVALKPTIFDEHEIRRDETIGR
jgi:hypothetical protein